ncbi:hypothetical protein HOLDEFILI_00059 [Holdemania filiformis DSM 12042]|uniref:Uncharacterized protein n=1 Tax=Holdemania filiformis DSM 12042 TaxID=545696 RepID=B9Y2N4_9FIRM|nr:hypothetical protein HOLDEFILI_00059 [Holdemania filiformis DSM 12042]
MPISQEITLEMSSFLRPGQFNFLDLGVFLAIAYLISFFSPHFIII